MKRKLVKQGSSTLMVSLPSKWIKQNKLDKGDEIDIDAMQNSLILSTKMKDVKKTLSIKIDVKEETLIRVMLTNAYRLDYDKIIVEFDSEEHFRKISKIVRNFLLGFEIVSREKNSCIIENITEPSIEQSENIFLKLLYSINELLITSEDILKGKNSQDLDEIEMNIQKYDNFVRRIATKQNNAEQPVQLLWNFYSEIVHAQREIYLMSRYCQEKKGTCGRDVLNYFNDVKTMYDLLKQGYMKKDIEKTKQIHELEKQLILKKAYGLMIAKKGKDSVITYRISAAIRGFYLASSPLIGLLLWKNRQT